MKVLLIGDSIRDGYCRYVREEMQGEAEVVWSEDNGKFAAYTLFFIREWIEAYAPDADVVCFNNGLWDVVHMHGAEENITSPEEYERTLRMILRQIRQALPKARIVWNRITPVIEVENRRTRADHLRFNADICRFNEIADRVMEEERVRVADLHSTIAAADPSIYLDGVHYHEAGYRLLAKTLAAAIREESKDWR